MGKIKDIPLMILLEYYDIEIMEEFEITNMADSPYHFNGCGSLCNRDGKPRNEVLSTLLTEPKWFKRSRKKWQPKIESTRIKYHVISEKHEEL